MSFFPRVFKKSGRIYADFASATPVDPEVSKAMEPYLADVFGNPASIHEEGRQAKLAIENARKEIALSLQVQPDEIVFTSGGTESNNLAIFGILGASKGRGHIITSSIEHGSVLEAVRSLESAGTPASYLSVDEKGRVDEGVLEKAITKETALISIAHANGEIGTIEKIRRLGRVAQGRKEGQPLYFHTDASQSACYLRLQPNDMHVDLLSIDASKIYGPKGVGLLFVKRGIPFRPLFRGGLQERGLRAGTENVAGIVGLAKALSRAETLRERESKRLSALRDLLERKLRSLLPNVEFHGDAGERLPHILNMYLPGVDTEFLSVKLDQRGIAVSSASACRSISGEGSSYVIEALPGKQGHGKSSLRISLGRTTRTQDIDFIAEAVASLSQKERQQ